MTRVTARALDLSSSDLDHEASGSTHTDDGAIAAGRPDVAATWFPADDHPRAPRRPPSGQQLDELFQRGRSTPGNPTAAG